MTYSQNIFNINSNFYKLDIDFGIKLLTIRYGNK